MAVATNRQDMVQDPFLPLERLRRQFRSYDFDKQEEIKEQRQARLYYHGSQWTEKQVETLKKRGQPVVHTPAFARKVNGFVGLVERLRQDPKAYPRTPHEEEAAELATAALRYVLDQQQWEAVSPIITLRGAVDAIAGIELSLEPGDSGIEGDADVGLADVEPDTFYYDPRSNKHDFSDARFQGISKWVDLDEAQHMFPDFADDLEAMGSQSGDDLTILTDRDREFRWFDAELKQVRIVEHWYKRGDKWLYCFFTGTLKLMEGRSPFQDEKGKDFCRFIMWRAFIDQDGDAYSFHRNMKPLVDEINQRRSKALHLLSHRRTIIKNGNPDDPIVKDIRKEAMKVDGVVIVPPGVDVEFEDAKNLADMNGQLQMLQATEQTLENFGPNPALVGQGVQSKSGKAIQLLQQAGIAELGPFMTAHRSWKIRVYRAIWCIIKKYWIAERWIRVTDQEGKNIPLMVNAQEIDPATGMPRPVNQIAALDVDIIIDEGPDSITMMADALDTLQAAMQAGTPIPAPAIIELLPIPDSLKKRLLGMITEAQKPDPAAEQVQAQAAHIQLAQGAANVQETQASAAYKMAQARSVMQPEPGQMPDMPTDAETMETMASAEEKRASALLKLTQAQKTRVETELAPMQAANAVMAKVQRVTQLPAGS